MISINSFEILPPEHQDVPSTEYVVLPNSAPGSMVNGVTHDDATPDSMVNGVTPGDVISMEMSMPEMTATEMCDRVKKLLQENIDLKDKVRKNNLVMHEQLNTISVWHEQITQTNNKHRTMLIDYEEKNQKLQAEKEALEKKIETLEEANKECSSDCNLLKENYTDLEKKLSLTLAENESIVDKLKQMEDRQMLEHIPKEGMNSKITKNEDGSRSLTSIVSDEESDYAIIIKEDFPSHVEASHEDIFVQYRKMQTRLASVIEELSEEKLKSKNLGNALKEREEELQVLQDAQDGLKRQIEEHLSIISELNEDHEKLLISLEAQNSLQEKYDNLDSEAKRDRAELDNLHLRNCVNTLTLEELQSSKKLFEEELKTERAEKQELQRTLSIAENTFKELSDKYESTVKLLKENDTLTKEISSGHETEKTEHQNQLDAMTARLLDMEQNLDAERQKVKSLQSESSTLNEDAECIPILKAQVEVYKTDLEAEKIAKSDTALREMALIQEVNDLKEQIKNLQETIQNGSQSGHRGSTHHNKSSRGVSFGSPSGRRSHGRSSHPRRSSGGSSDDGVSGLPSMFRCPCCQFIFLNLSALEEHVEECLNNSTQ